MPRNRQGPLRPQFSPPVAAPATSALPRSTQFVPKYEESPVPSGGGPHNGNFADMVWMLVVCTSLLMALGSVLHIFFLGPPLFIAILYVWTKRHPDVDTSFWMVRVKAAYLPWIMVAFAFAIGEDPLPDIVGIAVGHVYYFLQELLPHTEGPMKGWHLLQTPNWLYRVMRLPPTTAAAAFVAMRAGRGGAPPPGAEQPRRWGQGRQLGGGGGH